MKPFAERTHEKMKEVLMDPSAPGHEVYYYMIRGGKEKKNITVWEAGKAGDEYIKTYGHYHVGQLDETYWVLHGQGIVLLQTRKQDAQGSPLDDEIETFRALCVKEGDSVFIPSGAGHLAVNIGTTWLVTADDSPVDFEEKDPVSLPRHAHYEAVKKMRGFAYYVLEDKGKPTLARNPRYKTVPKASIEGL